MKISVIIPTIGRKSLERVLGALLECDGYTDIQPEILVIFNGEDNRKRVKIPQGISVIYDEQKSVSSARNIGIEESNGDVLAFLGDDTIPAKNWIHRLQLFHEEHTSSQSALLGYVGWTDDLAEDDFHQWLLGHAQFGYPKLKNKDPDWRFFYTSCVSIKRDLLQGARFSEQFNGWGFEDTELGYRLEKNGMRLIYDRSWSVKHDHSMTLSHVVEQTKNARKNAILFEEMHPEVKVLPTGAKKWILKIMIWLTWPLQGIQKVYWWREWKKAWLGSK